MWKEDIPLWLNNTAVFVFFQAIRHTNILRIDILFGNSSSGFLKLELELLKFNHESHISCFQREFIVGIGISGMKTLDFQV